MPNQLSDHKKRMTYSEFTDVYEALKTLALDSRSDVSSLIRQATSEMLRLRKHGIWKPAKYESPAEMRTSIMRRISYTEWVDVDDALEKLKSETRVDKSDLLREAVQTFLAARKKA
jgi:predicted transcriptional regulator